MDTVSALVISTAHEAEAVYAYENASRTYPTESEHPRSRSYWVVGSNGTENRFKSWVRLRVRFSVVDLWF
jgi:hypothetical protein